MTVYANILHAPCSPGTMLLQRRSEWRWQMVLVVISEESQGRLDKYRLLVAPLADRLRQTLDHKGTPLPPCLSTLEEKVLIEFQFDADVFNGGKSATKEGGETIR